MKKILIILAVLALVAAVGLGTYTYLNEEPVVEENVNTEVKNEVVEDTADEVVSGEGLNFATTEDMVNFVNDLYAGIEIFPSINTSELPVDDMDIVTYNTGLKNIDDVEKIVVSEPMMSSQAYSLILVKLKDSAKVTADEVAKEMSENVDPVKWICVSAEKIYATSTGNYAFLVMTNKDLTDSVSNAFKTKAGNIGQEYIVDNAQEEVVFEDMY